MMAHDEWTAAPMITVDAPGHGIAAIDFSRADANFESVGSFSRAHTATGDSLAQQIQIRVEVLRRLGGLSPRALLGGMYTPRDDGMFAVEVAYTEGAMAPGRWPSHLARRQFAVGLPIEFARAVIDELGELPRRPSGLLRIAHAGYDEMDSATVTFRQAARLLGELLVVENGDAEAIAREVLSRW